MLVAFGLRSTPNPVRFGIGIDPRWVDCVLLRTCNPIAASEVGVASPAGRVGHHDQCLRIVQFWKPGRGGRRERGGGEEPLQSVPLYSLRLPDPNRLQDLLSCSA